MNYTSFVRAKCARYPCLRTLYEFLSTPGPSPYKGRIFSIDFYGDGDPVQRQVDSSDLSKELQCITSDNYLSPSRLGQILLVENIGREIMSELGSFLSIDPMFFASFIHSAWQEVETLSPKFSELPSQIKRQHFSTFSYHRSLLFPGLEDEDYKLLRQSNIRRKVIVFSGARGRRVGLAQHCCSVLVIPQRQQSSWLGKFEI